MPALHEINFCLSFFPAPHSVHPDSLSSRCATCSVTLFIQTIKYALWVYPHPRQLKRDKYEKYCTNFTLLFFHYSYHSVSEGWGFDSGGFVCIPKELPQSSKENRKPWKSFYGKFMVAAPSPSNFSPLKVNPLASIWRKINIWIPSSSFTEFTLHCFATLRGRKHRILFYRVRWNIAFALQGKKGWKEEDNEWNAFCSLSLEGIKMPSGAEKRNKASK